MYGDKFRLILDVLQHNILQTKVTKQYLWGSEGKQVLPQSITNKVVDLSHDFGDREPMSPSEKTNKKKTTQWQNPVSQEVSQNRELKKGELW